MYRLPNLRLGGAQYAVVALLMVACGSDRRTVPEVTDAAVGGADARNVHAESQTVGEFGCADSGNAETGLQLIPEFVTAFRHTDAGCESLPARFLLNNAQQTSVQIKGARVSSGFSVDGVELPLELLPGRGMSIQVQYLGDALDSEEGTLTVSTSYGCIDFPVRGLAADGGLVTYSDLAMDFGTTQAGSLSESREFIVKYQGAVSFPRTVLEGFSAAPSEVFEIVASPDGPQSPESCDELRFHIRFHAPATLGRIEGTLGWTATTETNDGVAEGIMLVPLYGTATSTANLPIPL